MKISNLYLDGVKVKSESIDFHDGTIIVDNCDLSNVMQFLMVKAKAEESFNAGFDVGEDVYYESLCFASCIDEGNNFFLLTTSGVIENKINELESK